jgi:hypothetical protein
MKPTDAVVLDNWFPKTTEVVPRGGAINHLTGLAAAGETLAVYNALSGTNKMFVAAGTGVFDASSVGSVGAAVATITNARWQWINFGISTNHYLIMVNGVDKPLYYDGTTWTAIDGVSAPALTGVTTTNLIHVLAFKRRLFFIEKNKLSFWYLAIDTVGGALTEFRLGSIALKGGYLMACASWTRDGGSGSDDTFIAITSEGELIVYEGTDPGTAANWSHVGTYSYGKPLGRRCFEKFGGDLLLLTERGVFPLSATLAVPEEQRSRLALTNKIENAFNEASRGSTAIFGWQPLSYHPQGALIFNIPTSTLTFEQYVMNSITKAWCSFSSWNAYTFVVFNGELYMGLVDKVAKAWTAHADFGADITSDAIQAFNNLQSLGRPKHAKGLRYYLAADGSFTYQYGVVVDFDASAFLNQSGYVIGTGSLWDSAVWDTAIWGGASQIRRDWLGVASVPGFFLAPTLRLVNKVVDAKWIATDLQFELGDGL